MSVIISIYRFQNVYILPHVDEVSVCTVCVVVMRMHIAGMCVFLCCMCAFLYQCRQALKCVYVWWALCCCWFPFKLQTQPTCCHGRWVRAKTEKAGTARICVYMGVEQWLCIYLCMCARLCGLLLFLREECFLFCKYSWSFLCSVSFMALFCKCVSNQELHWCISHACLFKCMLFYLFLGLCVHAAVFSCKCVPRLSGQVTHRGDPFSASPDPRPQPLCLLWMCPLCLVPYPIILCPCSKNPCSPIVLLTCSTLPIVRSTPLSPFIFGQLFSLFFSICSSGLLHFHLYLHSLPIFTLILSLTFYPFSFHPEHLSPSSHFCVFCEFNHISLLSYYPFSSLYLFLSPS